MMTFVTLILPNILIAYVYCTIFNNYTNQKIKFSIVTYLEIILFSIIMIVNCLYNFVILKVFISLLFTVLLFKVIFKRSFLFTIYHGIYIFLISLIVDTLGCIILAMFSDSYLIINNIVMVKFFYSISFAWILYYVSKFKFLKKFSTNLDDLFLKSENIYVFIYLIFLIILQAIVYTFYNLNYLDFKYYLTIVFILIFVFVANYIFYKVITKNKTLAIKTDYLEQTANTYEKSIDDYRLLKHNLTNDMLLIKCVSDKEKNDAIDKLISKYNKSTAWVNNLKNIPTGIQGIIFLKKNYAKTMSVELYVENDMVIGKLDISSKKYFDLCEIFQIVLDNSIEASAESKNKLVYIHFVNDKNAYKIEIINYFINSIDLDAIGNKNYSTKNRNSGLGLNYINHLNKQIIIKQSIFNDMFLTSIIIKK